MSNIFNLIRYGAYIFAITVLLLFGVMAYGTNDPSNFGHSAGAIQGGLPSGSVILWDNDNTCPNGFVRDDNFAGITVRGAAASAGNGVPTEVGSTCSGGLGCDANLRYNDVLEIDELPSHRHTYLDSTPNRVPKRRDGLQPGSQYQVSELSESTNVVGNDQPHYHPFKTFLFCRKT